MLRSILVALDATPASSAAQTLAIALAKRLNSQITGIAILDRATSRRRRRSASAAWRSSSTGIRSSSRRPRLSLDRLERGFRESCEAIGAAWQVIEAEGVPHLLIEQESGRHDLLVLGKDTDFHFDDDPLIAEAVQRLLHDNARPLIVCPDSASSAGPVLVAYDGSVRASRALHMLALLGHVRERPVHVLSVAPGQAEADERARYATELLTKHELRGDAPRRDLPRRSRGRHLRRGGPAGRDPDRDRRERPSADPRPVPGLNHAAPARALPMSAVRAPLIADAGPGQRSEEEQPGDQPEHGQQDQAGPGHVAEEARHPHAPPRRSPAP